MERIFSILCKEKLLDPIIVDLVTSYLDRWSVSNVDALLDTKVVSEAQLADVLAAACGVMRLHHVKVAPQIVSRVAELDLASCLRDRVCPFGFEQGRWQLAVCDPTRSFAQFGETSDLSVATRSSIIEGLTVLCRRD